MKSLVNKQQGFSIVIALFILVVLSLLGAAMLRIIASGSDSVAREVISARALMAASSGAERMLKEIFIEGQSCGVRNYGDMGLTGCINVSIDCAAVSIPPTTYYSITSTGQCGPANQPSTRIVEVQAKDG